MKHLALAFLSLVRRRAAATGVVLAMTLPACSSLQEADPTGLLGGDEVPRPERVESPPEGDGEYPNLSSVPMEPPRRPSRSAEREALKEGLIADRGSAVYSDEPLRAEGRATSARPAGEVQTALGPDEPGLPPERPVIISEAPAGPPMPEAPSGQELSTKAQSATEPRTAPRKPDDGADAGAEAAESEQAGSGVAESAQPDTQASDTGARSTLEETQTAALPPAGETADALRVSFEGDAAELSAKAREQLAGLAERLAADPESRVQIRAFAAPTDDSGSAARRLSLKRALEVRSFLASRGVRSTRMDVRALGSSTDEQPYDRVDITAVDKE
ncbi:OmpA family protein [Ferruginivarius sediminum]|nr:OmpA family protein [Ferruginivarius sediminum]